VFTTPVRVDGIDNSRLSLADQFLPGTENSLEWDGFLSQNSTDSALLSAMGIISEAEERDAGEE